MVDVLKKLIVMAESHIGPIRSLCLDRKDPARTYSHDKITINGVYNGRKYELELTFEDETE